jgi:hypothetical protein
VLQYVRSPRFDFTYLLAPFWVSLVYVGLITALPAYQALIFLLSYILLTETHFASTWTIYLDARNRQEYAKRPIVYYLLPLVVIVGSVLVAWSVALKPLILFGAALSGIHAARQSVGIVTLYRAKARPFDQRQKTWENISLYLAFATFLGIGFVRFYVRGDNGPLGRLLQPLLPLMQAGIVFLAVATFACVGRVIALEVQRYRSGYPISVSKLLVFSYSLFFYSPYVFASRVEHALAIGAGVHYLQYLGLVWLMNRNKYRSLEVGPGGEAPGLDRRLLVGLSQRLWLRLPYLIAYGIVMVLLRQGGFHWDHLEPRSWVYSIAIGLQIVHYHIDSYIWRFSNPYIRDSVLPYLA